MKYHSSKIPVETAKNEQMIDITSKVQEVVNAAKVQSGTCIVFSMHTTCGITINENADPDVKKDIMHHLARIFPESESYKHLEGNSNAHLKVSTIGPSETVLVEKGKLVLGRWQGIMLCEFDGPRNRSVTVHVQGD